MAFAAALALTACGRKGPLDLPPSDVAPATAPMASTTTPGTAFSPSSFMPGASQESSTAAPGSPAVQQAARKDGFDAHGNPVAGQPMGNSFFLDPLLK